MLLVAGPPKIDTIINSLKQKVDTIQIHSPSVQGFIYWGVIPETVPIDQY